MFDLSKQQFDFKCPNCKKPLKATFKDVLDGKIIHCPGCDKDIHLEDDGSVKRSVGAMDKELKRLEKTLKGIGGTMKI